MLYTKRTRTKQDKNPNRIQMWLSELDTLHKHKYKGQSPPLHRPFETAKKTKYLGN